MQESFFEKLKEAYSNFWARLLTVVLLVILIIIACLGFVKNKAESIVESAVDSMQPIQKEEVKSAVNINISDETRAAELKDNWLIAAFGLDTRDGSLERGNSDVIMLVDINGITGEIKLASIYRDTCLKVSGSSYNKANSAYARGGPLQAVTMLNENFDLEIDDYISVNWASVAKAIDMMGGVDIDLTRGELRYINEYIEGTSKSTGIESELIHETGMQHLDGVQAVSYCRIRYTDSDFKRTERQRTVLSQLLSKAKSTDIGVLRQIVTDILPEVASSIEAEDLYDLIDNIMKLHLAGTKGFPDNNILRTVNDAAYVFPNTLAECTIELHEFLFGTPDYIPSDAVMTISGRILDKANGGQANLEEEDTEGLEEMPEDYVIMDEPGTPAEGWADTPLEVINDDTASGKSSVIYSPGLKYMFEQQTEYAPEESTYGEDAAYTGDEEALDTEAGTVPETAEEYYIEETMSGTENGSDTEILDAPPEL